MKFTLQFGGYFSGSFAGAPYFKPGKKFGDHFWQDHPATIQPDNDLPSGVITQSLHH